MKKLFATLAMGIGFAACALAPTYAQGKFPSGPITIVVPFAPGGASDITARRVAEQMSKETGYNIIVENKAGAAGNIAASYVARARSDGQTLLFATTNTNGINTHMYPDIMYDAITSFEPVGFIAENVVVLMAGKSFPADNLEQAIAEIRQHPDKYSYASPGVGTVHHLSVELLKKSQDLSLLHVPYKGAGPAMVDLVAGVVPLMIGGIAPAKPFLESGQIKVLGVANDRRFESLPEGVQYFSEIDPDVRISSWMGLLAPANTPADRIEVLSEALKKALASEELQESLKSLGMQAEFMTPESFGKLVADGLPFWKEAVEISGALNE